MPIQDFRLTRHVQLHANGVLFHVALAGREEAPLLLCLHGFPECWYSWRHQLEALSDRFLVAAPDLRGYGETEKPARGYELRNLAADAAGLVDVLGRERAIVAGHDWGGLIAGAAAAFHPSVVERLVLLNCPHPGTIGTVATSLDQLKRSWYIFGMQIPGLFDRRLSEDEAAIIPRIFKAGAKRRSAFSAEDLKTFRRAFARPGVVKAALAYYRTNFSLYGLLAGRMSVPPIEAPSLVLYGREDPFVGPRLFNGHERFFRGPYEIRYIPDCGHWTQQEVPETVNEALADQLRRPPARPAEPA